MQGVIYVVTNLMTGKRYVGQTTQPMLTRWKRHLSDALGPKRRPHPLHSAIRKYGRDVWAVEELATTTTFDDLNIREAATIVALGTLHPAGYNLKPGGGNAGHHEETKRKLAESLRGKKLPLELIERLRIAGRKRKQTPAQLAGLAKCLERNRAIAGQPGRKLTEAERAAMSAVHKGKPKTLAHRAAIGAAHVGMKRSPEALANMRAAWVVRKQRAALS